MRRGTIRTLLTLAATASLLAACGTGGGDDPTTEVTDDPTTEEPTTDDPTTDEPSDEGTTDETPSGEDAEGPEWPAGTDDQANESFEVELLLTDVRVAEHADFDRLVLEFEGEGEPGWRVGYVDEAMREGSGDPITLEGDAILQVSATHVMPMEMDGYYGGPAQFDPDTEEIEDVFVDGSFEGYTTVYLGLDEVEVFRVFTLTEPSRLVVDVQNLDD